ncbi:tetratricopeptide repeat protein [Streptomyces sp. NPDC098789]|uniref:tetratricopeptide repeat protein n=1 Tax=Streptomyces sp. NPDC098789 TaxID=3366098 RepID=UPI00380E9095
MVARLIDEDPEQSYAYARIALRLASRVAAVREAAGFAAYATQKYSEALAEFRAAKRMTGSVELWPVMADCERGLGRPERALAMAGEPEVQKLDKAGQVEMRLVAAGARRDMGQLDAAIVTLQSPELASATVHPWTARLRYAYADALLANGREDEAREWFAKTIESDKDGSTDASDRLAELDGVEFVDAMDDDDDDDDRAALSDEDRRVQDSDDKGVVEYYDEDDDEYEPSDARQDDEDDAYESAEAREVDDDDDEDELIARAEADADVADEILVEDEELDRAAEDKGRDNA